MKKLKAFIKLLIIIAGDLLWVIGGINNCNNCMNVFHAYDEAFSRNPLIMILGTLVIIYGLYDFIKRFL